MQKSFRAYLYTRSKLKEDTAKTKLRIRVIANGRERTAVIPLLVSVNFSKYYNSNGTLKEGFSADSVREKHDCELIAIAYQSACNVAAYMLSNGEDYWKLSPNAYFANAVNAEFDNLCDGLPGWVEQRKKNDAQREADGQVTFVAENLADWRYTAGIGIEPPKTTNKADWDKYFAEAEEAQGK